MAPPACVRPGPPLMLAWPGLGEAQEFALEDLFNLSGKVAIVTGGARGLGASISLGLARAGADVVVTSRKLPDCEALAARIEGLGRAALPVSCHMGHWDEIERLVDETMRRFGRVDVLVNNAASNPAPMSLADVTSEFFDKLYAINVQGPRRLAALAASRMFESGGGSIVNVISMGAMRGGALVGIYTSCKAALQNLTHVMAAEWADRGVRVNALSPGPFLTDMMRGGEKNLPGFIDRAAGGTLQKRVADPDEIIGSAVYLASDASAFVTGTTLCVSGGM